MGAYGMDEQCAAGGVTCLNKGIGRVLHVRKCKQKERPSIQDIAK